MDYKERNDFICQFFNTINDNSGNWDETKLRNLVETFYEEDAVWTTPSYHPELEFRPLHQVTNYWIRNMIAFPNFKVKLLDICHNPGKTWILIESSATHLGDFLSIKATGNEIKYEQMSIITWGQNSKIKEAKLLNDSLAIFQQLGKAIIQNDDQLQIAQYLNTLSSLGLIPQNS